MEHTVDELAKKKKEFSDELKAFKSSQVEYWVKRTRDHAYFFDVHKNFEKDATFEVKDVAKAGDEFVFVKDEYGNMHEVENLIKHKKVTVEYFN